MIDGTRAGQLAATFMEEIEEEHPTCELGVVMVVAELVDEDGGTYVRSASTDERSWVQAGLLIVAADGARDVYAEDE